MCSSSGLANASARCLSSAVNSHIRWAVSPLSFGKNSGDDGFPVHGDPSTNTRIDRQNCSRIAVFAASKHEIQLKQRGNRTVVRLATSVASHTRRVDVAILLQRLRQDILPGVVI